MGWDLQDPKICTINNTLYCANRLEWKIMLKEIHSSSIFYVLGDWGEGWLRFIFSYESESKAFGFFFPSQNLKCLLSSFKCWGPFVYTIQIQSQQHTSLGLVQFDRLNPPPFHSHCCNIYTSSKRLSRSFIWDWHTCGRLYKQFSQCVCLCMGV